MQQRIALPLSLFAATAILAATAGLGFAGWSDHGARILMAMTESGLAWCF